MALDGEDLIGYFAVLADSIRLQKKERPGGILYSTAPAIKLGRMGVDRPFRGRGVGVWILDFVVGLARELTARIGVRYVTLDALTRPGLVAWYEDYGFVRNMGEPERRRALAKHLGFKPRPDSTVSMRYDVLLAGE